jgi:hypothetical protein
MADAIERAGAEADRLTAENMERMEALLSIYDPAEKAAFLEGLTVGAYQAGRLIGHSESAALTRRVMAC